VINIIRKYRNFRGSLQCSQQPAVCSYTVLDDCVLLYYSMMINDPFFMILSILRCSFWFFWI